MRIATKGAVVLAALALLLPVMAAAATLSPEPASHGSDELGGLSLVAGKGGGPSAAAVLTTVYDNTPGAANFGFSSTDLAATWGDELFLTGTGLLSTNSFTIFNTGSSLGPLLTATVSVAFFDAVTSAPLGSYSTNVNFGAGLPPGFFSIVTVPGLDPLLILLNTTDIVVLQTITAKTGAASRLGIASMTPIVVGGSPNTMFINASTVGPAGFYNIGNPPQPANPGYMLAVNPPPVGTTSKTWGTLKKLYR
jgi:hypothetical protein